MDPLHACLLDLLYELRERDVPITVGGGFGLFLKRRHLDRTKQPILYAELPEPRATNDIDLFLRAELLTDRVRIEVLVNAIRRLGYSPVEEAKFLQWKRSIEIVGVRQEVKLDTLVGPLGEYRSKVSVSAPRVRPRGKSMSFHAHQAEEALFLDEQPISIELEGARSSGEPYKAVVYVPEAFPYLQMKLSAFSDRKTDENKDLGRHHALDAYTIVGMMTEAEYDRARSLAARSRDNEHYLRVCRIVAEDFASTTSLGVLRLREHPLYGEDFQIDTFISTLHEIFST